MAGIPKVKITFDADFDDLKKGIKGSQAEVETFADKVGDFGKKAAVAFGIAGAAIGAFALAAVKAAAEDETAQTKLQETIRNTTNATAQQIAGIDKYITKQSIATATTDDVLRPALSRLILATKDVTKAQELLSLAQEISLARNKPLEAVTNALGKAYEGSNTALGKLGIGISKTTLATASFDEIQTQLNETFTGFIENQSTTAAFKFEQITIAVNESKEAIGAALLPVVKELADFIIVSVVPAVESFVQGLTGQDSLAEGLTESQKKAVEWGANVRKVIDTVIDLKDELIALAIVIGTVFVVSKIAAGVTATIALIKTLITAYNALKASALVAGIATAFALNPLLGVGAVALAAGVLAAGNALANKNNVSTDFGSDGFAVGGAPGAISGAKLSGGSTAGLGGGGGGGGGGTTTTKAAAGIATAVASAARAGGAFTDSQNAARLTAQGGGGFTDSQNAARINLTVNGAIDAEGTARTIVKTLNDSFYRGTGGAGALQAI
jgi:hypothetical protein